MASQPKKKRKTGDKIIDERVPKLTGLILLFISFFLGLSMISYLFTWTSDHDIVDSMSFIDFLRSGEEVSNWLGLFGAIISNFFIHWMFVVIKGQLSQLRELIFPFELKGVSQKKL